METVAERIRKSREDSGLSQAELSRRVGVSRASVSLWEGGTTKSLKGENLQSLAHALAVDPNWILTGKKGQTRNIHTVSKSNIIHLDFHKDDTPDDRELFVKCIDLVEQGLEMMGCSRSDNIWKPEYRGKLYFEVYAEAQNNEAGKLVDLRRLKQIIEEGVRKAG